MDFEQIPSTEEQAPERMLDDLRLKLKKIEKFNPSESVSLTEAYNELMETCEADGGYDSLADDTDSEAIMEKLLTYQEQMQKIMDEYSDQENTDELSNLSGVDIPSAKKEAAGRLIDLCIEEISKEENDEPEVFEKAA